MKRACFLIVLFSLWGVIPALAQTNGGGNGQDDCIPGLPCVVPLTPNNPNLKGDGPNADGAPNAPKHSTSAACDADFMNQIYAKAWLESERQNVIGEVLIRKPDSVLQYSCFDQMAGLISTKAGPLFTESKEWDNKKVKIDGEINTEDIDTQHTVYINTYMEDDRMDKAIEHFVLESLQKYLGDNFNHAFLGGSSAVNSNSGGGQGSYHCDKMNLVYYDAKCVNMNEDVGFYTFDELANLDPRLLPKSCKNTDLEEFPKIIKVAENEGFQYAYFDRFATADGKATLLDRMIDSRKCQDVAPVPTGAKFKVDNFNVGGATGDVTSVPQEYEDKVCPKPGCTYIPQSGQCQ